ncbi:MAG: hypothetical protein ACLFV7_02465 [Phycisphaerae bacterium]
MGSSTKKPPEAAELLDRIGKALQECMELARQEQFEAIELRCQKMNAMVDAMLELGGSLDETLTARADQIIQAYDRLRLHLAATRAGYSNSLRRTTRGRDGVQAYQSPDANKPKLSGDNF